MPSPTDFNAANAMALPQTLKNGTVVRRSERNVFTTADKLEAVLKWSNHDLETGRWRRLLYRFMTDNVPAINSCVWTWVRLAAAAGRFKVLDENGRTSDAAQARLDALSRRVYTNPSGNRIGLDSMLPDLFTSLYRDGIFAGFLTVNADQSGVDQFLPVDPVDLQVEDTGGSRRLVLELDNRTMSLERPDFYYIPFNGGVAQPYGRSILQAIPFVTYVEQQLIDDMRRTSHNSGFHRLHVKISPPERMSGESDQAYTDRINGYFDSTVRMIKTLEVDDNPVTWDNVEIGHVAPEKSRDVTNSWFMSHRAMVEEICAGTNLAPYLLGYSYGATTTWSGFKFDVVMRQVRSVQAEVAHFLEWIGGVDLALAGIDARCCFEFDNSFAYQAKENLEVQTGKVDNVIKLYQAGLIDQEKAREVVWNLL
jgi:hypothetical protein